MKQAILQDAYIVQAIRTPVGKRNGAFKHTRPDDLLAHVLKQVTEHNNEVQSAVEDIIVGCAMPEGEQGMNVARIAALLAGFRTTCPH